MDVSFKSLWTLLGLGLVTAAVACGGPQDDALESTDDPLRADISTRARRHGDPNLNQTNSCVGQNDLDILLAQYGGKGGIASTGRPNADLNGDGAVDISDLGILLAAFGRGCPDVDIDNNGCVNYIDLVLVANSYGAKRPGLVEDTDDDGDVDLSDLAAVLAAWNNGCDPSTHTAPPSIESVLPKR